MLRLTRRPVPMSLPAQLADTLFVLRVTVDGQFIFAVRPGASEIGTAALLCRGADGLLMKHPKVFIGLFPFDVEGA